MEAKKADFFFLLQALSFKLVVTVTARVRQLPCADASASQYHQCTSRLAYLEVAWCSSCCGTDAHVVVWRGHPGRHAFCVGVWAIFHGCSGDVCRHCLECDHWPRPSLRGGEAMTRPLLRNLGAWGAVKGLMGGQEGPRAVKCWSVVKHVLLGLFQVGTMRCVSLIDN
jgi:hypothetical protein